MPNCIKCSQSFPTDGDVIEHAIAVHGVDPIVRTAITKVNLPPQIQPVEVPSKQEVASFDEPDPATTYKPVTPLDRPKPSNILTPHISELPPKQEEPTSETNKEIIPLRLVYKYSGTCSKGHIPIMLETDISEKHFVAAICVECDQQLDIREVVDLKKGNSESTHHEGTGKKQKSATRP